MQLNPHFLFNTLNMAFSSASCNGDEKTADIIEKHSGLMGYMTYEINTDKIELKTVEKHDVYMKGKPVPIGITYREQFMSRKGK